MTNMAGGKKIYVEKYVKDTNINNANIVINFDNVDLHYKYK
ncbi:hypothetical protein [Spiroplasma sp. ChiS]|nr:hypothetical protein [Spiroplasma sp. ChiS]